MRARNWIGLLILLHLAVFIAAMLWRPLLPVDETRYLSVAWDMWQRGDALVPYLNGDAYSHKPPLLFWLIEAGWSISGVSIWWPRLLVLLISLLGLGLTALLARRLWPDRLDTVWLAPVLLAASPLWLGLSSVIQFDPLLTVTVLIGVHALLRAADGLSMAWAQFALALAAGGLTKGPIILVHLLPLALLYPWWSAISVERRPLRAWYAGVAFAIVGGLALALAWAGPAALRGGTDYAHDLFLGQTAGRLVNSFAHQAPAWYYLPWLAALALPWLLSPRWIASLVRGWSGRSDKAFRVLLAWAVPVLLILSLISGKQLKYLLPITPAVALGLAALTARGWALKPNRPWPFALPLLLVGIGVAVLNHRADELTWFSGVGRWVAPAILATALVPLLFRIRSLQGFVMVGMLSMLGAWMLLHAIFGHSAAKAYDLRPISTRIAQWQNEGRPVATLEKYHGQFNFLGRLTTPVDVISLEGIVPWFAAHPNGRLVSTRTLPTTLTADKLIPVASYPYRSRGIQVWSTSGTMAGAEAEGE